MQMLDTAACHGYDVMTPELVGVWTGVTLPSFDVKASSSLNQAWAIIWPEGPRWVPALDCLFFSNGFV